MRLPFDGQAESNALSDHWPCFSAQFKGCIVLVGRTKNASDFWQSFDVLDAKKMITKNDARATAAAPGAGMQRRRQMLTFLFRNGND